MSDGVIVAVATVGGATLAALLQALSAYLRERLTTMRDLELKQADDPTRFREQLMVWAESQNVRLREAEAEMDTLRERLRDCEERVARQEGTD